MKVNEHNITLYDFFQYLDFIRAGQTQTFLILISLSDTSLRNECEAIHKRLVVEG